jgi:uncharacterized protein (TIRG00374 family)
VKKHATAWVKALIKYGIGFGLLGVVIYQYWNDNPKTGATGLHSLLDGPIQWGWLIIASGCLAIALSFQILRWYVLVRGLDLPFTIRNAFRIGMVGVFANTFLPGAVGGDFVKAYFIARDNRDRMTAAVATVIIDRAMGLFGLILFVAVLGSIAWAMDDPRIVGNEGLQRMVVSMAIVAASTVVGFLLLGFLPQRRVDRFSNRLKSIPKVGKSLSEFWGAVWMYRQRLHVVAIGVGLSAMAHFGLVFAFHCTSRVFPPESIETDQATLAEHMVIAPIGFIVQALPLSPGGVGVGEAAFAGLYKLSGRPESRGVIARLALRVVEWIIGFIGYMMYLRMKAHHELPAGEENGDENGNGKDKPPDSPTELAANGNQLSKLTTHQSLQ